MAAEQTNSRLEDALSEAVARRVRVDLVVDRITPGMERRLVSRFLGFRGPAQLVLDVPRWGQRKVHVPEGCRMGLAFPVGASIVQARTVAVDHVQYPLYPTRRVDALVVERPQQIASVNRRRSARHEVPPERTITVALWPAEELTGGSSVHPRIGRVKNYSEGGLGILFPAFLPLAVDTAVVLRLEETGMDECRICRARFRHSTWLGEGEWLAGFADVEEVAPGQAAALMKNLADGPS